MIGASSLCVLWSSSTRPWRSKCLEALSRNGVSDLRRVARWTVHSGPSSSRLQALLPLPVVLLSVVLYSVRFAEPNLLAACSRRTGVVIAAQCCVCYHGLDVPRHRPAPVAASWSSFSWCSFTALMARVGAWNAVALPARLGRCAAPGFFPAVGACSPAPGRVLRMRSPRWLIGGLSLLSWSSPPCCSGSHPPPEGSSRGPDFGRGLSCFLFFSPVAASRRCRSLMTASALPGRRFVGVYFDPHILA